MRKSTNSTFIQVVLLSFLLLIMVFPLNSTANDPPTRSMLYGMYTKLSDVDGSVIGEAAGDNAGRIRRAGDVNGDGFNDFMVMAWNNDEGGNNAGQTYLIFGKPSGWKMDQSLVNADASFIGEVAEDQCGCRGTDAGDVNGDGYDDIIIPSKFNDEGGNNAGQAYLILGKSTGWKMDTNLSNSDASFIGEEEGDQAGHEVGGGGDVNGDGYDDFLVCSSWNDENGADAGQIYLFFGRSSGWKMDTNLADANASFLGENAGDICGYSADVIADVNGDDLDDILIASKSNNEAGTGAGQVYLIFGKKTGWEMDTDLYYADASFWGENSGDSTGDVVESEGDLNGDGYNDILIGSMQNNDGGIGAGQVYVIFGKSSGWSKDRSLALSDASFIGEAQGDNAGWGDCLGDVNMDGYDDIVIGAIGSSKGGVGSGQVYVILGKPSGWTMDTSLSKSTASFYGENAGDSAARYGIVGDINGDGSADLVVGASHNDQGGSDAGQAYVIFLYYPHEPTDVDSIKTYSDLHHLEQIDRTEIGEDIYIKMIGTDSNPDKADTAWVNVSSTVGSPKGFRYWLRETEVNSGVYTNKITVASRTDPDLGLIEADIGEYIKISWIKDPTKNTSVLVSAAILLTPIRDVTRVFEDNDYFVHYENKGFNEATNWEFETSAEWLDWDEVEHNLSGSPDNGDVGAYHVRIAISDGLGNRDEHDFYLEVVNAPPCASPIEDKEIMQDEYFEFNCQCDDEGSGSTEWSISSYCEWLELDPLTGLLSGTPGNDDVGDYQINMTFDDGNRGTCWTKFNITVLDKNDPPVILTEPTRSVHQGQPYYVQFNAMDEDDVNTFEWYLKTDAGFLELNNQSGALSGVPDNDDVGVYTVNVSAADLRGEQGWVEYSLEVVDVNDAPTWSTVPSDKNVDQGEEFTFTVEASDVDIGDVVTYSISSNPDSDIEVDKDTGKITWIGSLEGLIPTPKYVLNVLVSATDGVDTIFHSFTLTVIPDPSPTSKILGPDDGKRITSSGVMLEWEGEDDGEEPLIYDIYLGKSQAEVLKLDKGALWMEDVEGTSIFTGRMEIGETYFWTVIPKDIFSHGSCINGIFSFIVNVPPDVEEYTVPEAKAGIEFRLFLEGTDLDDSHLEFSLIEGPTRMIIENAMISWIPSQDQIGTHIVNVSVTDGYETIYEEFDVEVTEQEIIEVPDEKDSPIVLIVVIILVILFIIGGGIGVFLFFRMRKGSEIEEAPDPNDTKEAKNGRSQEPAMNPFSNRPN